jgi:hypothetical protein
MKINRLTVVVGLNVVLILMVVLLALQVLTLKRGLAQATGAAVRAAEPRVGTKLPAIEGLDIGGRLIRVDYGASNSKTTLLLVYSPTCPFCRDAWPKWTATLGIVNRDALRVFAVDISAPGGPKPTNSGVAAPNWMTFIRPDPKIFGAYRFSIVPRTMVVDATGSLVRVWTGSPSETDLLELRATIQNAGR